mmetsp:Transcript_52255/g.127660  ORF Transcript_52255/g.127660 Transcript_52255/m.127660 type:complete len:201 (+) Transcript_52255:3798-4400(+)
MAVTSSVILLMAPIITASLLCAPCCTSFMKWSATDTRHFSRSRAVVAALFAAAILSSKGPRMLCQRLLSCTLASSSAILRAYEAHLVRSLSLAVVSLVSLCCAAFSASASSASLLSPWLSLSALARPCSTPPSLPHKPTSASFECVLGSWLRYDTSACCRRTGTLAVDFSRAAAGPHAGTYRSTSMRCCQVLHPGTESSI